MANDDRGDKMYWCPKCFMKWQYANKSTAGKQERYVFMGTFASPGTSTRKTCFVCEAEPVDNLAEHICNEMGIHG